MMTDGSALEKSTRSSESRQRDFGPLGEIALSLSGGGYRAAAFHLGTLSMLSDLGLLKDVSKLSTVSGGTIVAMKFMVEMSQDKSFTKFEQGFRKFLTETNVVTESIRRLNSADSPNGQSLMPSLIRAASNVYADTGFLGTWTLGTLAEQDHGIEEAVFNSTDFLKGTRFRFQISQSSRVKTGSQQSVPKEVSDQIRLADIVAASSCFPGGFEPFRFPGDFVWQSPLAAIRSKLGKKFPNEIPLMDGGVVDNQGIDSILRVLDREGNKTDLFIVSDTSQRTSRVYSRHCHTRSGVVPIWFLSILLIILFFSTLFSVGALVYEAIDLIRSEQFGWWRLVVLTLLPLLPAGVVAAALIFAVYKIAPHLSLVNQQLGKGGAWHVLRLTLPELTELLVSRIGSVLKMTTDVFMNRIRSLGFTGIYSDEKLQPILVSNFIYDLDAESEWKNEIPNQLHPTRDSRALAKKAERYPTTLNFDGKSESMEILICCGRMTTCLNLLRYLHRVKGDTIHDPGSEIGKLYVRTNAIWSTLNLPGRREGREPLARQELVDNS